MLETIRQFAEEQLVARGEATEFGPLTARLLRRREGDIMALWDSPRQREAYAGLPPNWPICAPRFGGPPTTTTSTIAATIATYAGFFGYLIGNYEPIAWAEELIEAARAVDHRGWPPCT